MTDRIYCWKAHGKRYHLHLRWWLANPLPGLWRWLKGLFNGKDWWSDRPEFGLRNLARNQSRCYCPTGSQTQLHAQAFGVGLRCWLSRDWTVRPCWCDACIWVLFGDDDEIEAAGGFEALAARFPELRNIKPLYPKVSA